MDVGEAEFERLLGPYRKELHADAEDGYSRWPDRAADPRRVETVFRRFNLPDHVD